MPTKLFLIALLIVPCTACATAGPRQPQTRFGAWILSVRTDKFTGGHFCKLTQPKIDYLRQALVLQLSRRTDTTQAVYRVDDGAPLPSIADTAAIVRLGFAQSDDNLDNPSGGRVRIPMTRLAGAKMIQVETGAFGRPSLFKIDGLAAALSAAQAAGCQQEDFR